MDYLSSKQALEKLCELQPATGVPAFLDSFLRSIHQSLSTFCKYLTRHQEKRETSSPILFYDDGFSKQPPLIATSRAEPVSPLDSPPDISHSDPPKKVFLNAFSPDSYEVAEERNKDVISILFKVIIQSRLNGHRLTVEVGENDHYRVEDIFNSKLISHHLPMHVFGSLSYRKGIPVVRIGRSRLKEKPIFPFYYDLDNGQFGSAISPDTEHIDGVKFYLA